MLLALGWQALEETDRALFFAREAANIAGASSFRYWSLVAHGIVADLSDGVEAKLARTKAQGLAEDLCRTVPASQLPIFRASPRIRPLLNDMEEE